MSDEDHDVDVESDFDEDDEEGTVLDQDLCNVANMSSDAKRAHHNALERKRRDHIKESFLSLRNAVPQLQNGRSGKSTSVSRSQILKSATSYIEQMTNKNQQVQVEINKLKKMNRQLEQKAERAQNAAAMPLPPGTLSDSDDDSEDVAASSVQHKRFKPSTLK